MEATVEEVEATGGVMEATVEEVDATVGVMEAIVEDVEVEVTGGVMEPWRLLLKRWRPQEG